MTDIFLAGLFDPEVQKQALGMKLLSTWSFSETVEEVLRPEVTRDAAGVAARGAVPGAVRGHGG